MQVISKNIKAIIWDWNGTLLNDVEICIRCINKLLLKRKLNIIDKDRYVDIFTFPVKDYYNKAGFDFSKEEFEVPAMEFIKLYHESLPNASLHNGSKEVLQRFKDLGLKQYVLSAMEHESLNKSLKDNGIYDFFIDINGIDNHYAHSKLDIGKELIKSIPFKKGEMIIIGDTIHDKDVADGLGIDHVLVAKGHQSKERLLRETHLVVDDLSEVLPLI